MSRLTGKTATIAGKPDFIEENYGEFLISDVKTGRASDLHGSGWRSSLLGSLVLGLPERPAKTARISPVAKMQTVELCGPLAKKGKMGS
ncbi:MAG: hypothetical protein F4X66_09445 [Chloroflexi bacterium]|nr:hypothetical protein [Chloroflexota bacterium]MYE40354.1 hypothetical protein [Chloroflexota bacterium]